MQGAYVLKPKIKSSLKKIEFSIGTAARVYFAFQNDIETPVDSKFKKTEMECALLKIETLDEYRLMGGQQVIAKEDVGMKIFYQD